MHCAGFSATSSCRQGAVGAESYEITSVAVGAKVTSVRDRLGQFFADYSLGEDSLSYE
jgi:hypothetical protein